MRIFLTLIAVNAISAFTSSVAVADATYCSPDPGPNLENYPVFHYGTEPPMPDLEGLIMSDSTSVRLDRQVTRGGESWIVGPAYHRGEDVYHEGEPFDKLAFRENYLTCSYENAELTLGMLTEKFRNVVADDIRNRLVDPYSVRSAKLGTLKDNSAANGNADAALLIACAEFNSKNRMGGYVGTLRIAYALREDGSLFKNLSEYQTDAVCANASRDPFPELGQTD